MFRKELEQFLLDNPMSVREIAREFRVPVKEIVVDLEHLQKSLRHGEHTLDVQPAKCRKCGFRFDAGKFSKPSRCAEASCRSTWIEEPVVCVRAQT